MEVDFVTLARMDLSFEKGTASEVYDFVGQIALAIEVKGAFRGVGVKLHGWQRCFSKVGGGLPFKEVVHLVDGWVVEMVDHAAWPFYDEAVDAGMAPQAEVDVAAVLAHK